MTLSKSFFCRSYSGHFHVNLRSFSSYILQSVNRNRERKITWNIQRHLKDYQKNVWTESHLICHLLDYGVQCVNIQEAIYVHQYVGLLEISKLNGNGKLLTWLDVFRKQYLTLIMDAKKIFVEIFKNIYISYALSVEKLLKCHLHQMIIWNPL